jgi:membrane-bound metal-dependent hydrolase YbcI (DUF457 family)
LDNLTHSLFALTLARTSLGRAGRGTTAALLIASNAPDIDIVAAAGGASRYLAWHRGPTHGPLGVAGLGVLTAVIVSCTLRWSASRKRRGDPAAPIAGNRSAVNPSAVSAPVSDASFGTLVAISVIGTVCHVLMDLPTSYGTRLLAPFRWTWFAVDWMPIVDVYLLAALGAGLAFGRGTAQARRRNAAIALTLMAANYGIRAAAHERALALVPRLFGPTLPPPCEPSSARSAVLDRWPRAAPPVAPPGRRCLVETAAMPTISPFEWRIIAQMSNAFELHDVGLLDGRFRASPSGSEAFWRRSIRYPNVWTPAVWHAASTPLGQLFLGFSRFPAARSATDASGTTIVRITDVRFVGNSVLGDPRVRANLFTLVVRIDADGRIVSSSLGR